MFFKKPFAFLFSITAFLLLGFGIPKTTQKRMKKEIQKVFQVENISMKSLEVSDKVNSLLPITISNDNLFKVFNGEKQLGYTFVGQAPSKTANFDYLVVFDMELKIIHSKVLVYREEYGGEIGSRRWLRQFIGKTGVDRVSSKTNIDAISGATISVRSMTNAVDNLLQTIGILQEKKILK